MRIATPLTAARNDREIFLQLSVGRGLAPAALSIAAQTQVPHIRQLR